jgi:putative membrane protein
MLKKLALIASATLVLSACGGRDETPAAVENTGMTSSMDATVANTAVAPADQASPSQQFVNSAAASDAFEITTSRLALANSQSAAVKKFANQMITAHEESTAKLKDVTSKLSPALTPDPTLTADQQATVDQLTPLKGAAFDAAYITGQRDGHQKTLDLLRSYSASGDVAELKTFASGLSPTVAAHLNMAKSLKP